ncbi:MAG: hypothetical protein QNL12_12025, partial [Acidimicrobiia bacterium]|nr:hypothetical protein [Acidimicrobiia bacterium]MDX2468035.1 hypothetical protein [Acidimicrobiia bacterium]
AGKPVFADYATTNLTFHVGSGAGQTLDVGTDLQITVAGTNSIFNRHAIGAVNVDTGANAAIAAVGVIDSAIGDVSNVLSLLQ